MYSVGEFGKLINKSVKTLQRWDRDGVLKSHRSPKNHRYYTEADLIQYKGLFAKDTALNIAYCRVSNIQQKDDLKNQISYINEFCRNKGVEINEFFEDIGSGLNFNRKHFIKIMDMIEHGKVKNLIIAHKDRLVRFGYEWFERFCNNHGCHIILINDEKLSPLEEITKDLVSIIHVFSSRIYGLRKYKHEISKEIKNQSK
jgi:putative resolvase